MLTIACTLIYLFILLVRTLKTTIKNKEVNQKQNSTRKTLCNNIKEQHFVKNVMQEFAAERIGFSR